MIIFRLHGSKYMWACFTCTVLVTKEVIMKNHLKAGDGLMQLGRVAFHVLHVQEVEQFLQRN